MASSARKTTMWRKMLEKPGIILVPGTGDALVAKIIQRVGFPALSISGNATSACLLGLPDIGFATMSEVTKNAANIASAVNIPVIADADTGYGDANNVARTVREFEKAGVAAIHIEDQMWPKRCGLIGGIRVIPKEEMVEKIKAATEARLDKDFVIIARTDARKVTSFADAINRLQSYIEAGADMGLFGGVLPVEELEKIPKEIPAPLMVGMGEAMPLLPPKRLEEMGYKVVGYATSVTRFIVQMASRLLESLKEKGTTEDFYEQIATHQEYNDVLELSKVKSRIYCKFPPR